MTFSTIILSASCTSTTVSVTGAVVGTPVAVSSTDGTVQPGGIFVQATVASTNTVTVNLCGTGTTSPKAYNVSVVF